MNGIVQFKLCRLSDKVDRAVDTIYQTREIPSRNIPARPDEDFDLLIGELIVRFSEYAKAI